MIPWLLNFKDKNIVIIGGGQMALKKAKQFLLEGANITIVSKAICAECKSLPCTIIIDAYKKEYLINAFLVYAATDNLSLNKQIVEDANDLHILSASASSANSTAKSMKYIETEQSILGLSTKNKYPAITSIIAEEVKKYDPLLEVLSALRHSIIKDNLIASANRKEFFHKLILFSYDSLIQLQYFLHQKEGLLLVFQGKYSKEANQFSKQCKAIPLFRKEPSYQSLIAILKQLPITWQIQPIVLYYGQIYNNICSDFTSMAIQLPLLINDHLLQQLYNQHVKRLFIIHPRTNRGFVELLSIYGDVISFHKKIDASTYQEVIPLLLTAGHHYNNDVKKYFAYLTHSVILKDNNFCKVLQNEIENRTKKG